MATLLGTRGNYYVRSRTTTPDNYWRARGSRGDYRGYYKVYYTHLTNGHTTLQIDTYMQRYYGPLLDVEFVYFEQSGCDWSSISISNTFNGKTKSHSISSSQQNGTYNSTSTVYYFSDTWDIDMTNGQSYSISDCQLVFGGLSIDLVYAGYVIPANPYINTSISHDANSESEAKLIGTDSLEINVSCPNNATNTIYYLDKNNSYKEIITLAAGVEDYTWELEYEELKDLFYKSPSSLKTTTKLKVKNNISGKETESSIVYLNIPNTIIPNISSTTYTYTYNNVTSLPFINTSKVNITINSICQFGTAPSKYKITYGNTVREIENSNNQVSISLPVSSSNEYSVSVIDGRGLESQVVTKSGLIYYTYEQPTLSSVDVYRSDSPTGEKDDDGTYIVCRGDYKITPLNNLNTKKYRIVCTKLATGETIDTGWQNLTYYSGNNSFIGYISNAEQVNYSVTIMIKDSEVSTPVSFYCIVGARAVLFSLHNGGDGITIGEKASGEGFNVVIDTTLAKGVTIGTNSKIEDYTINNERATAIFWVGVDE